MNGEVCCILGICCPPLKRAPALATEMVKAGLFPATTAGRSQALTVARWHFKHFDVVPAGTGLPIVAAVAGHARKAKK